MQKIIFSLFITLASIISFSQEKLIEKVILNNFEYKVIETVSSSDSAKKVYEIQNVIKDSIISKIEMTKHYKTEQEEYNSLFKLVDNVFTFNVTVKKGDQTLYGIDRFFIGKFGRLFTGIENGILSTEKPDETSYSAQFEGGFNKLRQWIQYNFDAQKLIAQTGMNGFNIQIKLDIDKDGTPILADITGNDNPKLRTEVERIIRKMPKWIPAKEKNEHIVSKFSIPVHIIGYD
ncbi:hypothetical protein F0358_14305 [Empedobacter brevis]|uniref:hypothetical protein n=1 Tax=Empedobacter brevis TaxID=247 RepID=UPI00123CC7F5|nr:hypothetical protein [Empedobacter brevis]QES93810.1 hypothetical protein F0358_14305 [Empedobacter brevis]